jgi:hypothetical protein
MLLFPCTSLLCFSVRVGCSFESGNQVTFHRASVLRKATGTKGFSLVS